MGKLVHVSSVHAYDMDPLDDVLDETRTQVADSTRHPAYDRSKALGERVIREYVEKGLDAVIVNPSGIMGPVDHGPSRLGQMLCDLANGKLPALLDGGFDCVDVRDVTNTVLAAGEKGRRERTTSLRMRGTRYASWRRWWKRAAARGRRCS